MISKESLRDNRSSKETAGRERSETLLGGYRCILLICCDLLFFIPVSISHFKRKVSPA